MDKNQDGVVTLDEFLECCLNDEDIKRSIQVFDTWAPLSVMSCLVITTLRSTQPLLEDHRVTWRLFMQGTVEENLLCIYLPTLPTYLQKKPCLLNLWVRYTIFLKKHRPRGPVDVWLLLKFKLKRDSAARALRKNTWRREHFFPRSDFLPSYRYKYLISTKYF